jgi:hypothetical protein
MIPRLFVVICALSFRWTVSPVPTPDVYPDLVDKLNKRLPGTRKVGRTVRSEWHSPISVPQQR